MKSAVFIVSAFLAVSCQGLTPIGPDGPDGHLIDPIFPGLIDKIPRPIDPLRPVCGPVCAIWCPNGNFMDSRGCPTCRCNPTNCMRSRSCFYCPYGRTYYTDDDGCRTCKCKPRPIQVCPVYVRDPCEGIDCPSGFLKDSNGCPTCNCKPVSNTCTYNGQTYSNGQSFKKDCNNCFCLNGNSLCTERACNIRSCRDGGKTYQNGESFKNDCNSCFCRNGRSLCTMRACLFAFGKAQPTA